MWTDRRTVLRLAGLATLSTVVAPGCQFLQNMKSPFSFAKGPPLEERPATQFVSYLNRQADAIQAISYTDVSVSVGTGGVIEPSLSAYIECAKPRYFRMKGNHTLQSGQMDVGSNDRMLWMYVRHAPQGSPNFIFANHDDLSSGRVQLPMPFDPDWIYMALGMSGVDLQGDPKVEINQRDRTYVLTHTSRTPQNEQVKKVTIFNGDVQNGSNPQVKRHLILSMRNDQPIATAEIRSVRRMDINDPQSGAMTQVTIPTEAKLVFYSPDNQKLSLDMTLRGEKVNPQYNPEQLNWLFGMPNEVNGAKPVNLASLRQATPSSRGQAPSGRRK